MRIKIDCNWHKCVDLGLPSGLLWATCNIGAKEPCESGLYFSWGNVDGHIKESNYGFNNIVYHLTPGVWLTYGIPVDARYDAARANLGGSWRMPTAAEFEELEDNCTKEWTTQNGITGMMFMSWINGNSVFFPAAGCYHGTELYSDGRDGRYWSSSVLSHAYYSHCLTFDSISVVSQNYDNPFFGLTIRPVLERPKDSLLIRTIKR